jgi:predicted amidohydrolase
MAEIKSSSSMTVALVQMQSGLSIDQNFQDASRFLEEAVLHHKADLVVFPENFLCMGQKNYRQKSSAFDSCIRELSLQAKHSSVALLLGSIPVPAANTESKCFSRSLLIGQEGELIGQYDKVHLFDVTVTDEQGSYRESDSFEAGQATCVLPVKNHLLGLSVCYDLRFPGLYQRLREEGAEMIAVPSAFTYTTGRAHWKTLLTARAIETQCFVLASNQCGEHPHVDGGLPRKTWGHSMIIDPWGEVLCSLDDHPGICSAKLDFEKLRTVRESMPLFQHRRF